MAMTQRDRFVTQMDRFFSRWDAWICPVAIVSAFTHRPFGKPIEVDGVKFPYLLACGAYTMLFNLTGNPVVVIAIGQSKEGFPIGIQIAGKRWHDLEVLTIAEKFAGVAGEFYRPFGY